MVRYYCDKCQKTNLKEERFWVTVMETSIYKGLVLCFCACEKSEISWKRARYTIGKNSVIETLDLMGPPFQSPHLTTTPSNSEINTLFIVSTL